MRDVEFERHSQKFPGATRKHHRCRGTVSFALGLIILLTQLSSTATAESLRFALIIGNNQGHDRYRTLRYAEQDARKMFSVLTEVGGFEQQNVQLLLKGNTRQALAAMKTLEKKIQNVRQRSEVKVLLFFYYSGHADEATLELGPTALSFDKVKRFIEASGADVRVAVIDSCHSGRLVAMKGGRPGPAFQIKIADQISSSGYAIITSSADDELSQESAEVRGSFFTHFFVSALRGAADQSADGMITLAEAYRFTYRRTVARTSATISGGQHPMYDFKLRGKGDVVLSRITRDRSLLTVSSSHRGRLVVLNGRGDEMIAEGEIGATRPVQLGLAAGSYLVYLISAGVIRQARVTIGPARATHLDGAAFSVTPGTTNITKGGLFVEKPVHRLGAGFLLRRMPFAGPLLSYGVALHYRREVVRHWLVTVLLTCSAAPDADPSAGYVDVGVHAGGGYRWPLELIALRAEVLAGFEQMMQAARDATSRYSSSFTYGGLMGADVGWGRLSAYLDFGAGGRIFRILDEKIVHRLDLQLTTGISWSWSSS